MSRNKLVGPWIDDADYPHCSYRALVGTDHTKPENRVAFIEKTPRVRISSEKWEYGDKGCGTLCGRHQPSRDWCDQKLKQLGYTLYDRFFP